MPAYSDRLSSMIDQTGIETLFGSKPVQLPKLNDVQRETLRTGGLMALMRSGVIAVDPSLLHRDPSLEQTSRVLSEPEAIVRVAKAGVESAQTQFWAFVQSNQIVQLSAGAAPSRPPSSTPPWTGPCGQVWACSPPPLRSVWP